MNDPKRTPDGAARHYREDDMKPSAGVVLPLDRFTVSDDGTTINAEASDFGPCRDGRPWLRRLFLDAIDVGLFVRSPKSGNVVRFYHVKDVRDEGDLAWQEFTVYERDNSLAGRIRHARIYND